MSPIEVDAGATVACLRESFQSGRTRPLQWRLDQLDALIALLTEQREAIIEALASDLGKPGFEAYLTEVGFLITEARHVRARLRWWLLPRPILPGLALTPALSWLQPQPRGVVLIIAPWNYPVQLALSPMIGALAAGNAVLLKPSEVSAASSALLAELIPRYLDPEAVRVVQGGPARTGELLAERFDHIFFTGGSTVARIVARAAAQHLTPTTLELGGRSPAFVDASTDLVAAARSIVWGKFINAGQTCIAPDHVLATPQAHDRLVEELKSAILAQFGPDPQASSDYGRIISEGQWQRLVDFLADGEICCGGAREAATRYLAPTVLTGVHPEDAVMQQEIFGPVLPLVEVSDARAAIDLINAGSQPLTLYVFSQDRRTRRDFRSMTSSGSLVFGTTIAQVANLRMPFGGVGESGMGAYHGRCSLDTFSHLKPVLVKPQRPDTLRLARPPIGPRREALLRRVLG